MSQFTTKKVKCTFSMFRGGSIYDVILGRDSGQYLGINVHNKNKTSEWDTVEVPKIPIGHWTQDKINRFHEEY